MREARDSELESCARLQTESEPWKTLGLSFSQALQNLREPTRQVWVALQGDEVAGFCAFDVLGTLRGFVKNICVNESLRGKGLGRALLRAVEERIFQESPNVFLCVSSFNPAAQRFYEREGFRKIGELEDFLIEGESEVLMRKTRGPWMTGQG